MHLKEITKQKSRGCRIYDPFRGVSVTLAGEAGGGGAKTGLYLVPNGSGFALSDGRRVRVRKLTPKECFRLQGWPDRFFELAQMVNSDSQLYKQAGNGVTVNVIEAIGRQLE